MNQNLTIKTTTLTDPKFEWSGFLGDLCLDGLIVEDHTFPKNAPPFWVLEYRTPKGSEEEQRFEKAFRDRSRGDLVGTMSDGDVLTYKDVYIETMRSESSQETIWSLRYELRKVKMAGGPKKEVQSP